MRDPPSRFGAAPSSPVAIAEVLRAVGLKGDLSVRQFNAASGLLAPGLSVWVSQASTPGRWMEIQSFEGGRLRLRGISDRTRAEELRGSRLAVERTSLPAVDPDEVYLHDLLGFGVVDAKGRALGRFKGLQVSGKREYFVVEGPAEVWLPVDAPFIETVEGDARLVRLSVEVDPEEPPSGV